MKHVEFYSKNKFEKSVHLVGFVIRIYHDARSPERQVLNIFCICCGYILQISAKCTVHIASRCRS